MPYELDKEGGGKGGGRAALSWPLVENDAWAGGRSWPLVELDWPIGAKAANRG